MKPDYNRSIVNIPATLLTYYGLDTPHASLSELKETLKKDYKHIILMVLDGFGMNMLTKLDKNAVLPRHYVASLTSTFPSTTVAATTALLTAKTPYESGYIGWFQYIRPFGIHYTIFMEEDYYYPNKPIPASLKTRFNKTTIFERVEAHNKDTKVKTFFPHPIDEKGYKTFDQGLKQLRTFINSNDKTLSYIYSIDPDMTQHKNGTSSKKTLATIKTLNHSIESFKETMTDDTLLIITADHGLTDVEPMKILDDETLTSTFEAYPAIEPRAATFFIKDDKKAEFKKRFTDKYGSFFELFTKEELLDSGYLGFGEKHPLIEESLGNYFSIAKGHYYLEFSTDKIHKAHHAGLSVEEMEVPLILIKGDEVIR